MPKTLEWFRSGARFTQTFVAEPSCCPSRSSLMTGRFPHNNGVRLQADGPSFDSAHSLQCYLQSVGYATFVAGKFLTTWPKTQRPACFELSTVIYNGYGSSTAYVDGTARRSSGYSTTYLGKRGREYVELGLASGKPFYLYEAPHAPHWSQFTDPDGSVVRAAIPDAAYADLAVPSCAAPVEADRRDKPPYVRFLNTTPEEGQRMCSSQLRAIRSADDEIDATLRLLSSRGALDDTVVVVTSDNGYLWADHGRMEKFVPYEGSVRVPMLLR